MNQRPFKIFYQDYFFTSQQQRTGETIFPSTLRVFMAFSTNFLSNPESSAISPAYNGLGEADKTAITFSIGISSYL